MSTSPSSPPPPTALIAGSTAYKVSLPDVERLLPHDALLQVVEAALSRSSLVWLAGPPGAGKSGLAAQAVRRLHVAGGSCVWYRLDEEDADVAGLFDTLRHHPALSEARGLPAWSPGLEMGLPAFARRFFAALAPCAPLTLVFDDCHRLADEAVFFDLLDAAREACAPGIRLLAVGRRRPPSRLMRGELAGWLEVIDDLRWNDEEALRLGAHAAGRPWTIEEAELLQAAQGWPAHVIAIGRALRRGRGPDAATSAGRAFGEYLANELLLMLPQHCQQEFRLLAELPDVPRELVQHGHVSPAIGRVLDELAASGYFVESATNGAWRLHDLLRDALRDETQRRESDTAIASARRRLAGWVRDVQPEVAMQLLVAANDTDGALALLRNEGKGWLAQGRHRQVSAWIASLRQTATVGEPLDIRRAEMLIWEAEALLPLDPGAARLMFGQARRTLAAAQMAEPAYRAWYGEATSFNVEWATLDGKAELVDELDAMQAVLGPPGGEWQCRAAAAALSSILYVKPDDPRLPQLVERTARAIEASRDCNGRVIAASQLMTYHFNWSGDIRAARVLHDTFDRQVDVDGSLSAQARLAWWSSSVALDWVQGDPAHCHEKVLRGLELADATGVREHDFFLLCQGLTAALATEDLPRARELLDRLSRVAVGTARVAAIVLQWHRSWFERLQGDAHAALAHAEATIRSTNATGRLFHQLAARSLPGPALLALGDIDGARQAQRNLFEQARVCGCSMYVFIALWDAASIAEQAGDTVAFRGLLDRLLQFKELGGFHTHMRFRAAEAARWMAFALDHDVRPHVARLWIREKQLVRPDEHAGEWPVPVRIGALKGLAVEVDGSDAPASGVRPPQKLRELLALLVAARSGVSQADLCYWLWPDSDGDRSSASLKTAVQRLRTWLGRDAVVVRDGIVALNPLRVQCDLWQLLDAAAPQAAPPLPETVLAGFDGPPISALRRQVLAGARS